MVKSKSIILFVVLSVIVLNFGLYRLHCFLSEEKPVKADILIFEAWIYDIDNSIQEAITEMEKHNYKLLIIVGFTNPENLSTNQRNDVENARNIFENNGISTQLIHTISVPYVIKHKSYSLALAVRFWLEASRIKYKNINVFTFGPHARKSEVVFKQAMEPYYNVGILSAKPTHYNPKFWWISWSGFKWVFFDTLKYIRALL